MDTGARRHFGHRCCRNNRRVNSNTDKAVRWPKSPHRYTGIHVPCGITLCYLPPSRDDTPAFIPAEASTRFSDPGGMQGWVDLVGWLRAVIVYPKTVTHPSTNRVRRRVTSFMRRTTLATTPHHQRVKGGTTSITTPYKRCSAVQKIVTEIVLA